MKKILLPALFAFLYLNSSAQVVFEDPAIAANYEAFNKCSAYFNKAYAQYPEIPKGILEAVSYTNTRFNHITHQAGETSCTGIPQAYGIMGLMADGKKVFKNNLSLISQLSGYSAQDIIGNPEKNILAYAKAYSITKAQTGISSSAIEDQIPVIVALSEFPTGANATQTLGQNFGLNSNLYTMLAFLNNAQNQLMYHLPQRHVDLIKVFGQENYNVLSASSVSISGESISNNKGEKFRGNIPAEVMGPDYGPAIWTPAASCNYSVGRSMSVTAVAIHDMEGSYGSAIYWFQDCASNVSAHYCMRSSDGQVTQMVLESNTAQHVYTENAYSVGIEHEGYASQSGWYTTALYNSSSALVRSICSRHSGVSTLDAWYGASCSGNYNQCLVDECIRIKGHQMFPNGGHYDPGIYWDWRKFYHLLNPMPALAPLTAAAGNTYDSGGANGNYTDSERDFTLIAPTGASKVTLTFSSFDMESGADHLFIYDGNSTADPLIGKYTGTTSPGTITSSGGALLLEFRSDCSKTFSGWAASWTSVGADNVAPTTAVTAPSSWVTQDFSASFTDADNSGGSGLDKSMFHVVDYNGTEWRANHTLGFFRDNFDNSLHADWAGSSGTWAAAGGYLVQSDESLSNTCVSAPLTQNLSNRYVYNWLGKIDGAGTNRRAGLHFMCDNASSSNRGNSYLVWLRADQGQVEIYKSVNDVLGTPLKTAPITINAGTFYDFKVIYDRSLGTIDVYINNSIACSYTDPSPLTTGSYVSFRTGDCSYSIDNFYVFRSRGASVNVSVGSASSAVRYQNTSPTKPACMIKSIVMDKAGNLSSIASQSVNVDWTAPLNVSVVRDGTTSDVSVTSSSSQLSANWDVTTDPHSDVVKYWYAIGTTAGGTNIVNWTSTGLINSVTKTGLSLVNGQTYFVCVKAENGAGLLSSPSCSNGQTVQLSTAITEYNNEINLAAYPNPFREKVTISYETIQNGKAGIQLIDALGKEVNIYAEENQSAGKHNLDLNTSGLGLTEGVYILKIVSGDKIHHIKVIFN